MSISEDIKALEEALGKTCLANVAPWHQVERMAEFWAEANPGRIRRLLDALIDEESRHFRSIAFSNMETTRANVAEARLSKAIDLLKEARAEFFTSNPSLTVAENVDAFLKEVSE